MTRQLSLALAGSLLALTGCTAGPESSSPPASPAASQPSGSAPASTAAPSSPSPSESASGSPGILSEREGVVIAPEEGDCYRLRFDDLPRASSHAPPVPCRASHTTQTIHVGRLDLPAAEPDPDVVAARLSRTCHRRMAGYLGGDRSDRRLSRFQVVWFTPSEAELDAGADWFRCDVIAFGGHETLAELPRPRRLSGVLDRRSALERYGLCGTAAPGAPGFQRVICSQRHSWQAIATIHLGGGAAYPGTRRVRAAGDDACRDRVRAVSDSSLRFRYGWEWPTREQWRHGQHYGFCWAPD